VKSLIVYYSRTGNAKFVAEKIAGIFGSDIEEIIDLKSREGKMGWMSAGRDASTGRSTKIAPTTKNPHDYDVLIIGTPVWAWNPSAAIRTYLNNNDLTGKKVALFFTFDHNLRQVIEKTKALMPNSKFVGELAVTKAVENKEETEKNVLTWCDTLKTTSL